MGLFPKVSNLFSFTKQKLSVTKSSKVFTGLMIHNIFPLDRK